MLRSFPTLAVFALLGASVIALPALAPKVEAGETMTLAKGDRLQADRPMLNCANEVWPHVAAQCLRTGEGSKVPEARFVTAGR
jgi:hypothetical protein